MTVLSRTNPLRNVGAVFVLLLAVLAGAMMHHACESTATGHAVLDAPVSAWSAEGDVHLSPSTTAAGGVTSAVSPAEVSPFGLLLVVCCAVLAAALLLPVGSRWLLSRRGPDRTDRRAWLVSVRARAWNHRDSRPAVTHSLCVLRV